MEKLLEYPFDSEIIMRKQKSIKRALLEKNNSYIEKNIAILGGYTTDEIKNILELFLLKTGIKANFYQSEYNKYYEDSLFPNEELENFKPDIIIVATATANIINVPQITDQENDVASKLELELQHYKNIWQSLKQKYNAIIIQNNFELPHYRLLGNLDSSDYRGLSNFVMELNRKFAEYARNNKGFYINDVHYLSAQFGLDRWQDRNLWHAYKFAVSYEATPTFAHNVCSIIKGILGKSSKCLVLDLDNTLWGGVIGDDGLAGINIGTETPVAEAYTEFQKYAKELKARGIILAVCSKNDLANAKEGFTHPDSILQYEDFISFKANWEPKHINIKEIAEEINIGLDSLVFIDDNPVERQIVRENLPLVIVPEIDVHEITGYQKMIDRLGLFEPVSISQDDLVRNNSYKENIERQKIQNEFNSYEDFLQSLNMQAEIKSVKPIYLERITQLTNKTNQFNLTTKRYTIAEIEEIASSEEYITLYGRLTDKFGDNGLVSIIIGYKQEEILEIKLWLMSCRVLKRGMEEAMFDELVKIAKQNGIRAIKGYYYKTAKNNMVSNLYANLGFTKIGHNGEDTVWQYVIPETLDSFNKFIKVEGE